MSQSPAPATDWRFDARGETALYRAVIKLLRMLIFDSLTGVDGLLNNPNGAARLIVSQLAHKYHFAPANHPLEDGQIDWTSINTRSNSSALYIYCVESVELTLMREKEHLSNPNARERVAGEILLQLMGRYRIVPTPETEAAVMDES